MANGVYPYITATIIFQLLTPIIPQLERMSEEGETGRRKLTRWQYYLTIPLAMLQAFGQARIFSAGSQGDPILPNFGFGSPDTVLPTITVLFAMTAGTMFAIWLGELISEQGIGNGISLIIFSGIVARMPQNLVTIWTQGQGGTAGGIGLSLLLVALFLAIMVVTMFVVVYVQEGERRIPVQYGKRVRGNKIYQGAATHIPLKVNMAGMIPLIFAQSFLTFPAVIAQFFMGSDNARVASVAQGVVTFFSGRSPWYGLLYFVAVVAFTYFYTDVMVQQQDLAGTLKRQGGFIPGKRPGKPTADFINAVYRRITLVGALFLGGVAVLPFVVEAVLGATGVATGSRTFLITSSGLLIVVGVVIDTMRQLEAQLMMRNYEGFIK
jgi:preprotein translocase subunit SecY